MAYDSLADILQKREKQIYSENPWYVSGVNLGKQDFYSPESSTWENLGAALLGGFGSGAMQTYGRNKAEDQYRSEASALGDILAKRGPLTPMDFENNDVLDPYKSALLLNQREQEARQEASDSAIQRQMELAKYQQQMKAAYAKPAGTKVSKLEQEAAYLEKRLGPDAARSYLLEKANMLKDVAPTTSTTGEIEETALEKAIRATPFKGVSEKTSALKEYGKLLGAKEAISGIKGKWGKLKEVPTLKGLNPFGKDSATFDAALFDALPSLRPLFGAISEHERELLKRRVPNAGDTEERIAEKERLLIDDISKLATMTPTLDVTLPEGLSKKWKEKFLLGRQELTGTGGFTLPNGKSVIIRRKP